MKLDDKILRLAESVDSEVQRALEKHRAKIAPYDDVAFDDRNARLTYRKGEDVLYNGVTEEVATLGADGSFSWGWAQRPGYMKRTRKVEVAKALFDQHGLKQLLVDEIQLDDRSHAERLVRIVLHASHADGVFRVERGSRAIYYALFEAGGLCAPPNKVPSGKLIRRMTPPVGSVRAPAPSSPVLKGSLTGSGRPLPREEGSAPRIETLQPRRTASGTLPAVTGSAAPPPASARPQPNLHPLVVPTPAPISQRVLRSDPVPSSPPSVRPVVLESPPPGRPSPPPGPLAREPSRAAFMPVAQAVFADISAILPGRITQAILIVNVRREGSRTFSLEVVAMDSEGKFRAVEASRELRKITSDMISVDETSGNGTWRRLVAYISMQNGPSLTFEVK